jgi:hypothetical protein
MCIIFIDIMERPVSDIFSTCIFNNIMEVTFIFSPRVFSSPIEHKAINLSSFSNLMDSKI